jgi:glycosyltransferase involved in cell wall biosynthesis
VTPFRPNPDCHGRHVAILLPNLGGGGAERAAIAVAAHLADAGHQVDLLLVEATGALVPVVPKGVRIVDLKAHRLLAALPPLVRYLRAERPDVLNAHMWPLTVIAIMAHRLAGSKARLVVVDHTTLSHHVPAARARRLLRWTTRLFYPLADERIVVSKSAAEDLAQLSGLAPSCFKVVHGAITPPPEPAGDEQAKAAWRGKGARILSVGSLKQAKNHALLLDAFARLDNPEAQLLILGEGELRADLERQAAGLGIAGRVSMPGFAIDPWPYYASADLFVLSSDYEGAPLVLAEAMHAGARIVSTDCTSAVREMLGDGRYGRIVPCNDAAALAAAMDMALTGPADPKALRLQAEAVAGSGTDELAELLLA